MLKFSGGVDVRKSNMFKVMGGSAGASAMFKVMWGVSAIFKVIAGEGVSGANNVQGNRRGWGASAMFKVMAVSHVQGDDRGGGGGGVRGISHVQGDGRGWGACKSPT